VVLQLNQLGSKRKTLNQAGIPSSILKYSQSQRNCPTSSLSHIAHLNGAITSTPFALLIMDYCSNFHVADYGYSGYELAGMDRSIHSSLSAVIIPNSSCQLDPRVSRLLQDQGLSYQNSWRQARPVSRSPTRNRRLWSCSRKRARVRACRISV